MFYLSIKLQQTWFFKRMSLPLKNINLKIDRYNMIKSCATSIWRLKKHVAVTHPYILCDLLVLQVLQSFWSSNFSILVVGWLSSWNWLVVGFR